MLRPLEPLWLHQKDMRRAGLELARSDFEKSRVGAWNAGILSAYRGGGVVNLDGLVNGAVVPYIEEDRLYAYVRAVRLDYIVDYEAMLTNAALRRRGGYDEPSFLRALVPIRSLGSARHPWADSTLTLYRVQASCD